MALLGLGAGTYKLTGAVVAVGVDVTAIEADPLRAVRAMTGSVRDSPFPGASWPACGTSGHKVGLGSQEDPVGPSSWWANERNSS
jgi:hypothetical protein